MTELGQDRAPGGLGRVGGEYRTDLEPGEDVGDDLRIEVGCLDPVDGLFEVTLAFGAGQFPDPVGLLGHVGEIEVGREGPDQFDGGGEIELLEEGCETVVGLGVALDPHGLGMAPDLLDQVQQLLPVLAGQGLSELGPETANVGPQGLIGPCLGSGGRSHHRRLTGEHVTLAFVLAPTFIPYSAVLASGVWRLASRLPRSAFRLPPSA